MGRVSDFEVATPAFDFMENGSVLWENVILL